MTSNLKELMTIMDVSKVAKIIVKGISWRIPPAFNCSKLTIGTLEQGVKYVQI